MKFYTEAAPEIKDWGHVVFVLYVFGLLSFAKR
jgi:hypothetical protein